MIIWFQEADEAATGPYEVVEAFSYNSSNLVGVHTNYNSWNTRLKFFVTLTVISSPIIDYIL